MSVVALPAPLDITPAGVAAAYTGSLSTGNTYTFSNDGRTFLHCKKSGAGACTVTLSAPNKVRGQTVTPPTWSVPASTGDVMVGPFPPDVFNDANGLATVAFSEITGLTVAPFRMAPAA